MEWEKSRQNILGNATDQLDSFQVMKQTTMLDTNVATLAYVEEVIKTISKPIEEMTDEEKENGEDKKFRQMYGIARVRPLPRLTDQDEMVIEAYYFDYYSNPGTKMRYVKRVPHEGLLSNLDGDPYDDKEIDVDVGLEYGKIVLVVFTDKNFLENVEAINTQQVGTTSDNIYHSLKYGVIVKTY